MQTVEEFAGAFPNELVLQQALAKLLSKIPNHSGVQILQGSNELGKDIIFYTPAAFGQKDLNACVVKNTKITGNASTSTGARTVFNQAQQALDSPVLDENGHEQQVKRVFIITPHPIPPETVASIAGALRTSDGRVQFVSGAVLLDLFKQHWPEYLAEEFSLIQTYADALTQTAAVAKELDGLSFHYQLGTVSTSIKRVYVQPHFHRFLRSYSLRPLRTSLKLRFSESPHTEDRIEGMKAQVNDISAFMGTIAEWGLIGEAERRTVRAACKQLVEDLAKSWSLAVAGRAARAKAGKFQSDSAALKLSNVYELNKLLDSVENSAIAALSIFERNLESAKQYMKQGQFESAPRFSLERETIVNKLNEVARISGAQWLAEGDEESNTFTAATITNYDGSLFIVAPAGFGKTTFCRWNALNDLERLLQGESDTLPVYVPLHQVSSIEKKSFKDAFLQHAGVSALLPKDGRTHYEKTRVYLDGLDEVASQATQKHIAQLAEAATKKDPTIQIIITARDYVYGPWMTWLPRIHLSGFDDAQVRELVEKWLENNTTKVALFFDQLDRSRSLKDMTAIPLLATLIVLVFKQTDKLPENKTRLYEMFVDLHNGGWDLVKNIQRPSHFSATEKMFVLKRIAAAIHGARRRELLDSDVAKVAKEALREVDWKTLRSELLRDGLIIQMGSMVSFAHHSFQEFLTAKYLLGDLDPAYLSRCCDEYLRGSDWWQEVLCFYLDLAGKPQETKAWVDDRLRKVVKTPTGGHPEAEERAGFLKQHLEASFPFAKW